ncbi:hypothetical protein B7R54_03170 [Subtercola boreus]|uniref:Depolymerase 2 capsule K5-specific C-terminal domain-containing protein n=1 Tax=Subtercola boreus TaxID=120213 RepID=A0A3E0VEH9_9MICO|nr:hypothetical protein B7R54_03170 [Subtercola boreus]
MAVTSISTANPDTVGGGNLPVSVIKISSSQGWVRGDVLKIVSDDIIPEGRPGSSGLESRLGEFVVVRTANGQTITLAGLLREDYSTNVRVAKISEKTFALEGAEFETTAAGLTSNYGSLIYLYRLKNPTVSRVKVVNSSSAVIHFASCFGYSVYDADIAYAVDNPQNSQVGYGVFDNASSYGRVIGGLFRHVRHAYTDDTGRIATNSALTGYGRTYGARIIGGSALNTTSNSWDTHHCSEGTEFISCTATGGLAESTFGQAGFGIRGKNHRVTNGTVLNMDTGVNVFNESGGGETHGTVISNLVVRNAETCAVQVFVHSDGHPKENIMDTEENVTINGLTAVDCGRLINAKNAVVTVRNAEYAVPAGADGVSYDGITTKNSIVRVYNSVLDYSKNTKGTPRPVVAITSTGYTPARQQTFIDGLEVRLSASVAARGPKPFNGVNHEVSGRNIRFDYPFSVMPGDCSASSTMQWSCTAGAGAANADLNSSYVYISSTALKTPFAGVLQSSDLQVIVRAVPGASAYSVAALPAGKVRGQFVTLWMNDTSSGSLTIANGTAARTLFIGGTSKVLKKGMQLRVFWDGTLWRETT